jgi:HNH endonuclease
VCKATEPLEIEHIEDWSIVKAHTFENMIVLCANCHGRKNTSDPHQSIKSQAKKADLMTLNGRYSDLERRSIEAFQEALVAEVASLFFRSLEVGCSISWALQAIPAEPPSDACSPSPASGGAERNWRPSTLAQSSLVGQRHSILWAARYVELDKHPLAGATVRERGAGGTTLSRVDCL